jgi:filamentous hemagglutinin family protein
MAFYFPGLNHSLTQCDVLKSENHTLNNIKVQTKMTPREFFLTRCLWLLATVMGAWPLSVMALPQDGQVITGEAQIQQASPNRLNIVQSSDRAVINWTGFGINGSEWVDFQQPSVTSATLNRVTGNFSSEIAGRLTATGQVLLINPNGILFTPTAQVNVGSLLGTTLDINNSDFMKGALRFWQLPNKPLGTVENQGTITVKDGGFAALVAPGVANSGVINARLGQVVLGSGTSATLDFYGDGLISFAVDPAMTGQVIGRDGKPLGSLLSNSGTINADGSVVALSAQSGSQIVNSAINMDGLIQARTVENKQGEIVLSGGNSGSVAVSGTLDVSGLNAGQSGGTIKVLGQRIDLSQTARLLASGDSGGGAVLIGGDYQGKGGLPTAFTTTVNAGSQIEANGLTNGKGGKVIVWADGVTTMNGSIFARGGLLGGDGGFVETSGKTGLSISSTAQVNVGANIDQAGTWLLDPDRLFIASSFDSGTTLPGPTTGDFTVDPSVIESALYESNVDLAANALIQVDSAINSGEQTSSRTLSFTDQNADGNLTVNLNAPIQLGTNQTLTGEATTVNVNQPFANILQNGVDVAASGATVNVASGTFTGTGSQVVRINKNLTVQGQGAGNTIIDGEQTRRVFDISGNTVNLSGLTITNGQGTSYGYGGGVYAYAGSNLTIADSTISNNTSYYGGGIYSSDDSTYGDTSVSNNLTITNSTISGNSATYGGGIYHNLSASSSTNTSFFNNLTVTNSTISGNTATYGGGGIYNYGSYYNYSGNGSFQNNLTITNSTISGNSADSYGGGIYDYGYYSGNGSFQNDLTAVHSTISGNSADSYGGGIYNSGYGYNNGAYYYGKLNLTDSTAVANNSSGYGGGGIYSTYSGLTIANSSFSGNSATSGNGGGIYSDSYYGTSGSSGDSTITNSTFSNNKASGYGGGLYHNDYTSNAFSNILTITGSTFSNNEASYGGGIYSYGDSFSLTDSIISNNLATSGSGGGIYRYIYYYYDSESGTYKNNGNSSIANSNISGNSAYSSGGGIYNNGPLSLTNSTISGNSASNGFGGGIYNDNYYYSYSSDYGNLSIANSIISGNSASSNGGGIYNYGPLSLTNSTISGNSAGNLETSASGGGIYNNTYYYYSGNYGNFSITNSTISGNSTTLNGGGVYNYGYYSSENSLYSNLLLTNSTISGNSAGSFGGGLYNDGPGTITYSTISGNSAGSSGGGIFSGYYSSNVLSAGNSIIAGNRATTGPEVDTNYGTSLVSNGFNLFGQNGDIGESQLTETDIVLASPIDTVLGPLADNGGPTFTHALLSGSPAINAGSSVEGITTDQRGSVRSQNGAPDIGAFESGLSPTPGPTDPPTPGPTDPPTPGPTDPPTPGPTDPPTPRPTDSPTPGPTDPPTPGPTDPPTPGPTDPPTPGPTDPPTPGPTPISGTPNDSTQIPETIVAPNPNTIQEETASAPPSIVSDKIATANIPPQSDAPVQELDQFFSSTMSGYLGTDAPPIDTVDHAKTVLGQISTQIPGVTPSLIYVYFAPAPNKTVAHQLKHPSTLVASTDLSSVLRGNLIAQEPEAKDKCLSAKPANPSDPIWQFDSCGWERLYPKGLPNQANDQLVIVLVTSDGKVIRKKVPDATRANVVKAVKRFQGSLVGLKGASTYLPQSQQLYKWLIAPLEEDLKAKKVNNLVFVMDKGLRSLPMAALHDGKGFIVERFSVGFMPSLALSDTRHVSLHDTQVLAMGASEFKDLAPLPSVPLELSTITEKLWPGQSYLNENFTPQNLKQARSSSKGFGIVHLATHGDFQTGRPDQSYINFWNNKIPLTRLQELNLTQATPIPISLLVLSACRTALGDQDAELGFTGLAVSAGVQTAMGGLWTISDLGTLALMTGFYHNLKTSPIKAEALRLVQVSMLKGQTHVQGGQLVSDRLSIPLTPKIQEESKNIDLTHPYYWSGITMVGNPW